MTPTNNEGKTPIQRFRKLWGSINKDNKHLTTEMIEDLIESEIKSAHQSGREEMKAEVLKAVPEEAYWFGKLGDRSEWAVKHGDRAAEEIWNSCREQTITNITKIEV